jgi:hypothetical protein
VFFQDLVIREQSQALERESKTIAQFLLKMSGQEFLERWDAGEWMAPALVKDEAAPAKKA